MRCLGIDYGERRIGLAISDLSNTIASSLAYLSNSKNIYEEIKEVVTKYNITHIIIGMPLLLNGDKGDKSSIVEDFSSKLESQLKNQELNGIEIIFEDERLTTVSAERILIEGDVRRKKRKTKVDSLAASLILQKFLDRN